MMTSVQSKPIDDCVDQFINHLKRSRFIELFGDLKNNSRGWPMLPLVCLSSNIGDGLHGTPVYDEHGEYAFVNGNNLRGGVIVIDTKTKMVGREQYEKYSIPLDDTTVLVSINGTLGNVAFYRNEPIILGKSACYINLDTGRVNKYFFKALIDSPYFLEYIESEKTGTTINNISLKSIRSLMVPLPPMELQLSYVEYDKQVDLIKEILKQIVSKHNQLVKSRFIEMFDGCDKAPLTEMADITMGQSPDSSTYNDQGIGVPFFQGKTEFTDTFVRINKYCTEPKKMAKRMDILMSVRAPVGAVNLTSQECCIGRGLAAITPKDGVTDVWFLFNALRIMEQQISDMGVGSTFTAISKDDMKKIKIPVAPLLLQNQFSDFVKQVDKSKFGIIKTAQKIVNPPQTL